VSSYRDRKAESGTYASVREAAKLLAEVEARGYVRYTADDPRGTWVPNLTRRPDNWRAGTTPSWRQDDVDYDAAPGAQPDHNSAVTPEEHQMVLDHMPLVWKWAGHYAGRTRGTVFDDLVHIGQDELYAQLPRWDRTRGFTFGAFVEKRVKGAMVNYLERDRDRNNLSMTSFDAPDGSPADDFSWVKDDERDDKPYRGKKPKPGPSNYADATFWRRCNDAAAHWRRYSEELGPNYRDPRTLSLADAIEQALATLTPNQREVYGARVMQDPPVEVSILAKRMGVSERRVRALEAKAQEKVSARLKEIWLKENGK
jgi:RNA polymerase sigma factor (sigma-70 family)